jgi:hypothetical protein
VRPLPQLEEGASVGAEQQFELVGVGHADQRSRRGGRVNENPQAGSGRGLTVGRGAGPIRG